MSKKAISTLATFLFTLLILFLGYISFGLWPTIIFTSGFLGGFILWLLIPGRPSWSSVRTPFFLALVLFILHRVEEKVSGFFNALSELTGVPTPEILSVQVILLIILSVGAWLSIPYLVKRKSEFGYYLIWTFFAAMGITELAHFFFPFAVEGSYSYFPGMLSVIILAPVAWWGMYRLSFLDNK